MLSAHWSFTAQRGLHDHVVGWFSGGGVVSSISALDSPGSFLDCEGA